MGSIHLSDQWDVHGSPEWSVGCVWFTRANCAEALGPRTDPAAGPTEAEGDGAGPEDAHSFCDGAPVLGRAPWLDPGQRSARWVTAPCIPLVVTGPPGGTSEDKSEGLLWEGGSAHVGSVLQAVRGCLWGSKCPGTVCVWCVCLCGMCM